MPKSTSFSAQPSPPDRPSRSNNNNKSSRSQLQNTHHSSSGNQDQESQDQQNDLLDVLMKHHSRKCEEAAKTFSAEIDRVFESSASQGKELYDQAEKSWNAPMSELKRNTLLVDTKDLQEAFEQDRQEASNLFATLKEKSSKMGQPSDGLLENLPLVFQGRPKRLKDFRRSQVAAFKRDEAELIEYKKTANGAKVLTEAVKKSFG